VAPQTNTCRFSGVERQHERTGRPLAGVQDLARCDRLAAGLDLLGDVEIRPQRQPDPRDLALGRLDSVAISSVLA